MTQIWHDILIISESLARRFFGDDDPLGQQIGHPWTNEWWTIVGVVNDVIYETLDGLGSFSNLAIYRPMDRLPAETVILAARTQGDPRRLLADLRALIDGIDRSRHEIGVRLSVGADQQQILGWILRRALLLSAAGIALGWLAALAVSRFLEAILFGVGSFDWSTFMAVALLLLSTALLAALVPALQASRTDPLTVLRAD